MTTVFITSPLDVEATGSRFWERLGDATPSDGYATHAGAKYRKHEAYLRAIEIGASRAIAMKAVREMERARAGSRAFVAHAPSHEFREFLFELASRTGSIDPLVLVAREMDEEETLTSKDDGTEIQAKHIFAEALAERPDDPDLWVDLARVTDRAPCIARIPKKKAELCLAIARHHSKPYQE